MKEKFKEIALQAGGSHYPTVGGEVLEKFAELIVQECIGIVENLPAGYKDYRDQIEDAFRRDCITKLKDHFGVNE